MNKIQGRMCRAGRSSSHPVSSSLIFAFFIYGSFLCIATKAFSTRKNIPFHNRASPSTQSKKSKFTGLKSNGEDNNAFDAAELTSTLARLDQQWSIQQRVSKQKSRWTKLIIPEDDNDKEKDDPAEKAMEGLQGSSKEEFVYLLEPPNNNIPSCLVAFVGGAGLGQFPHIAYSEFLTRLSDRLNAAVIAVPYQVGLDHFALSKQTGEKIRKSILLCEDDPSKLYPPSLPTYSIGHSLGCKLQTIYLAATGQQYEGMGFISFNNFSFAQTIQMARSFATQIRGQFKTGSDFVDNTVQGGGDNLLETIFGVAENILGVVGVDFSPNAASTEKLIQLKFDTNLQRKTRLFVFDDDKLDSSRQFMDCCGGEEPEVMASGLPGTHLTPVYLKFGIDNVPKDVPEEAKDIAKEALGGFESASFGNEDQLNQLVQEVCDWILGKGPSRRPWQKDASSQGELPRITGMSTTDV